MDSVEPGQMARIERGGQKPQSYSMINLHRQLEKAIAQELAKSVSRINTGGGAYVTGNVSIGGDFVGGGADY